MARIGIRKPLEGILTHLQSLDVLNFAAIYNGQFDMLDGSEMYSFPMPCAFIEVLNPAASLPLLGGFIQKDIVIRVHIGVDFYNDTNGMMEQNFVVFDVRDAVLRAMNGYKPENCSTLQMVGESQDYAHTNVYHYMVDFATTFIDTTCDEQETDDGTMIEVEGITLEVNAEIQTFNFMQLNFIAGFDESFNNDFETAYTIADNTYGDLLAPEHFTREMII